MQRSDRQLGTTFVSACALLLRHSQQLLLPLLLLLLERTDSCLLPLSPPCLPLGTTRIWRAPKVASPTTMEIISVAAFIHAAGRVRPHTHRHTAARSAMSSALMLVHSFLSLFLLRPAIVMSFGDACKYTLVACVVAAIPLVAIIVGSENDGLAASTNCVHQHPLPLTG